VASGTKFGVQIAQQKEGIFGGFAEFLIF